MLRTTLRGIGMALVGLLVYGCGNDYMPDVTAPGGSGGGSGGLAVIPSSAQLGPGQSVQLAAKFRVVGGATIDSRTVTWSSSNATVATVDASGLVTASTAGFALIIAQSSEGETSRATIQVLAKGPKPPLLP